jgi:competence protein ComEA
VIAEGLARAALLALLAAPSLVRALSPAGAPEVPRLPCADTEVVEVARGGRAVAACAGAASARTMRGAQLLLLGQRVDLNRASAEDLADLPGIGEGLARRIVRDRDANGPFRSVEDLARVPGVGERRTRALAEVLEVR